ncbi:MAG: Rossmann-like and DUF2520 domain-containing protein [Eubacterium sp.]
MKTGIIGAGKVGFTIGKYFSTHGLQLSGYYSRSAESSIEAAHFTGSRSFTNINELARESDVLFLTVPDGKITTVYKQIDPALLQGKLIGHTSGALSSEEAFPDIEDTGAYAFSVHPMSAVSDRYHAYVQMPDVFFAIEGDDQALDILLPEFEKIGLHLQKIDPEAKTRYHCAAAIASNLVNALLLMSIDLLESCGFTEERARAALTPLVTLNVNNALENGIPASLTGPVERADEGTIRRHLGCLEGREKQAYCLLSEILLPAAQQKHPDRNYQSIENLLQEALSAPDMQNICSAASKGADTGNSSAGSVLTKSTTQGKDGLK